MSSMAYDRVLPKPLALYNDLPSDRLARRSSNLLQHKIMTDSVSKGSDRDIPRRSTFESIPAVETRSHASQSQSSSPDHNSSAATDNSKVGPLTRKRAASLMASDSSPQQQSPSSSPPVSSVEAGSQFCLCQPDPKIPRPRNAFILYRQHHQGSVVAQHPGLANPEISKIIGEQWRALPIEVKNDWKALAEEEKARHQQQYPDYRYQPRRYGRNTSTINGNSVSIGSGGNCSRCGGKIMNPPSTPNTPYSPGLPTPSLSSATPPNTAVSRFGPQDRVRPQTSVTRPPIGRPRRLDGLGIRSQGPENIAALSPDPKRRRFDTNGGYAPVRRDMSPDTPYPYTPRRASLPRPEAMQPRSAIPMGPPLPPYRTRHPYQPAHDPGLTLPPLRTSSLSQQNRNSIEAMVLTIPFINKIKVLSKISPALAPPGPTSPAQLTRGTVIAVEGQDPESVKTMLTYLSDLLSKDGSYSVQIFEGPDAKPPPRRSSKGSSSEDMGDATVVYLDTISAWHKLSDEIVKFVTTTPPPATPGSAMSIDEPAQQPQPDKDASDQQTASGVSPKTIIPKTAKLSLTTPTSAASKTSPTSATSKPAIPVALIPNYQLTTTDHHAISIPINDAYAPLDHWQWAATLWRGCVGPDVTVLVRECERDELERAAGGNAREAMPVEVRLEDARAVVVRKAASGAMNGQGSGKIDEKALRRVGFEVEEFLRR